MNRLIFAAVVLFALPAAAVDVERVTRGNLVIEGIPEIPPALVERMRRSHEVTCVAFAHGAADFEAAAELRRLGIPTRPFAHPERWKKLASLPLLATRTPLTLGVYGSRALQAEVDRQAPRVDLA